MFAFFCWTFFKIIVISFFKKFFSIHQQNVNCHGFFVQAIYKNPSVTWKPPKSTPIHQIRGLPRNQKKSRKEKVFFVPFWRPSSGRFHVESRVNNFEILSHQPFVLPIAWHVWRGPLRVLPLSSSTRSSWSISFLVKQVQGNFPIESICFSLQGKMIRDPLCFFFAAWFKVRDPPFSPQHESYWAPEIPVDFPKKSSSRRRRGFRPSTNRPSECWPIRPPKPKRMRRGLVSPEEKNTHQGPLKMRL